MKQLLTSILLGGILFSENCSSQDISYDNDTISVDGNFYAVMKKKNSGVMKFDYIVVGNAGTELIYFKSMLRSWYGTGFRYGQSEELYYEVNFFGTGNKAELKHYTAKGFAKLVAENNLINGNRVDAESEKRFIMLNNGWFAPTGDEVKEPDPSPMVVVNINNGAATPAATPTTPVPVRSKSPVTVNGNQIIRDERVIGKFREDTTSSTYSQKTVNIVIYSDSGEKVAEASVPVADPQEWNIKILSEEKTYHIMYDSPGEKENLFRWLADKNYIGN